MPLGTHEAWTQIVKFMSNTVNSRGSVLEKESRTEQDSRKYQEQEKDQGLEHGSRSKL